MHAAYHSSFCGLRRFWFPLLSLAVFAVIVSTGAVTLLGVTMGGLPLAAALALGAIVAFAGLVVVLEGGAAVLAFWLPAWAPLLIVGAVIILVGGLISRGGLAKLSLKAVTPERSISSVQKDARMIKEHT